MISVFNLGSLVHNLDRELNLTALNSVSESNRNKFHSKNEDQKKKEELVAKTRTDKELEL